MPNITIDRNHCPIHVDNIRTVGELIPKLKEEFLDKSNILLSIQVDEKKIIPGNESLISDLHIDSCNEINFITEKRKSIAQETIDYLPTFLDKIINDINYSLKEKPLNQNTLYKVIEEVDIFIQLMTNVHKVLEVESNSKMNIGLTIKELEVHLLFILKAIDLAFKKEDNVMLEDLLEYELIDNLTQWKIQALPKIKKLNSL